MTDRSLAYAIDGPEGAPLVVLSSSLGTTRDMWEPQMPALTATWRVLRVDHPGHGASPIWDGAVTVADIGQAILDLLDDLGFQRLSFCGLSLGGAIGQWIAAHAPQRVERLILCSAASSFDPAPYLQRAATVRREGLADVAAQAMGRWFTPDFRTREPETVARYRAMVESIPPEGYAACCEAVAGFDAHSYLGRITAPTLVLLGAEDPVVQPEQGQALAGGIPAARLQIVERAAHLFNVERPDETDRAIAGHLEGSVHD